MRSKLLTLALCAAALSAACGTPLDDYVNKPDPAYAWEATGQVLKGTGWTGYVLNMTSQRWLRPEDFVSQWGHVWIHDLVIIVPDTIQHTDAGMLYITGGGNHNGPADISASDEDIFVVSQLAVKTGMVGAALFQVPNQRIQFAADPLQKSRSEDGVIAFTWWKFVHDTSNPEWLLRLPMTKAAIRALDTMAAFASHNLPGVQLQRFFVAGASKRGWTTWTVGATDKRVAGIMPLVLDALQFQKFMHRHYRSYNGWSFALQDYHEMNITQFMDDPRLTQLSAIVDPYYYRDRLTMPKLIISAVGDEFQLVDDTRYWLKDLPGASFSFVTPNAEHSLITGIGAVLDAATGFVQAVVKGEQLPQFTWDIDERDGRITVHVSGAQPDKVKMWWGSTVDGKRRDFRWAVLQKPCYTFSVFGGCIRPILWFSQDLAPRSEGTYVAAMAPPGEGWRAFFMQLKFGGVTVSTPVSVVPDVYPYPDCEGNGCRGELV